MRNAQSSIARPVFVGRRQHPGGSERFTPWLTPLKKAEEEIWYLFQGQGEIREEDGPWTSVHAGMLVWFPANRTFDVRQHPDHPIGNHFFHFTRPISARWDDRMPRILETTDPSFLDSLSRRIIELYWEVYFDQVVIGGKDPGGGGIPRPRFMMGDPDVTRNDVFLPGTMGLRIPGGHRGPVSELATNLFNAFVGEYRHLAGKKLSLEEVGIHRHHRQVISDMVALIQSDLRSAPAIPEMAASCGYSLDHFGRIFRKIMGCSPQEFLIKARTARARQLLIETGMSIKEIAFEVGYHSPYFFSRQFKFIFGEPPSALRKRLAEKTPEG